MLKNDTERFQDKNYHFENVTISENGFFNINKSMIGATLPEVTILPNYKYAKINLAQKNPSSEFLVNGWAENTIMWFTTKNEDLIGNEKIVNCSDINLDIGEDAYVSIDLMNADWLYFQFSNVDTAVPKVELLSLTELGGASVNKITSSITLLASTTPSLNAGLYVLDAPIYIGSASPNNLVYSTGELIYYDSTSKIFYGTLKSVALENGTWTIYQNENIENELSDSRNKIPTSHAVYEAVQNAGSFYTPLQNDITFNLDGTISDSTGTLTLTDGFYLTKLVNYVDDEGTNLAPALSQNYCYYNSSSNRLSLTGLQRGGLLSYNTFLSYLDSTNGWFYWNKSFADVLDTSKIETTITSGSTDSKVASAKAVYDATLETYSSNEIRIGTWINGKPLYRKVYTGTFPQVATDGNQASSTVSLTSLNPDKVMIEFSGAWDSAGTGFQNFPLMRRKFASNPDLATEFLARAITVGNILYIQNNISAYNNDTYVVSLLYTKTTD